MADDAPSPPPPAAPLSSSTNVNRPDVGSVVADMNKSRSELAERLQKLKQEMMTWKSRLDTQVKTYKTEILELKSSLNIEVEQLRSDFQEMKMTLQQQQEDVNKTLETLGIQDVSKDHKTTNENEDPGKEERQDIPTLTSANID